MASFKDNTGCLWTLDITYGHVLAVRAATGHDGGRKIDLLKPHEGTPPTSSIVASDLDTFCDVLQVLLAEQLKEQQLDVPGFVARMGGKALCDANDAFMEAWIDFFQQRRQPAQAELIRKSQAMAQELNNLAAQEAQAIDTKQEASTTFRKVLQTVETEILTKLSGGSPASSVEIPGPTASGSSN